MAALVFGPGPLHRVARRDLAVDRRAVHGPDRADARRLEAQRHRRFIKSHLAADGLRFFPQAKYIVVGRDTRDVFMSLFNHYSAYTDLMYAILNDADRPGPSSRGARRRRASCGRAGSARAGSTGSPTAGRSGRTTTICRRGGRSVTCPNILFVHFGDLKADPEAEMRRIAAFCEIDVDEDTWPALLATVGLDAMRDRGARRRDDPMAMVFEGGAARFFYKGDNGRWRDVLTDDDLALYEAAAATLDPALRQWLEGGRHAISA